MSQTEEKYGEYVIATAKLFWISKKGASCMRQGNAFILAKRLETLRCAASLRLLDGTKIGGCEKSKIDTDKRVRWVWWYDKSALFTEELIGSPNSSRGKRAWETAMGMRGYAGSTAEKESRQ